MTRRGVVDRGRAWVGSTRVSEVELRQIRARAEEGTESLAVRDRRALLAELDRINHTDQTSEADHG